MRGAKSGQPLKEKGGLLWPSGEGGGLRGSPLEEVGRGCVELISCSVS